MKLPEDFKATAIVCLGFLNREGTNPECPQVIYSGQSDIETYYQLLHTFSLYVAEYAYAKGYSEETLREALDEIKEFVINKIYYNPVTHINSELMEELRKLNSDKNS